MRDSSGGREKHTGGDWKIEIGKWKLETRKQKLEKRRCRPKGTALRGVGKEGGRQPGPDTQKNQLDDTRTCG